MDFSDSRQIPTPSTISSHLLNQVRRLDCEGWQRMVRIYGPLVYRWGRRAGLQAHDASDLVQDVFRSVLTGINAFKREQPGDSFRGWLWTITYNRIRDQYRHRNKHPQATGGSDAQLAWERFADSMPSSSSEDDQHGEDAVVRRALSAIQPEFEPRTWKAFWKAAVDGQSAAEIAAELEMTAGAVRQAKYRVLLRLRQALDELG